MKKEEKIYPIVPSNWIQFLIDDQNQARNIYFSEEMSIFTKTIIMFTITAILVSLFTLTFNTFDMPFEIKFVSFFVLLILFIYVIAILRGYISKLSELKRNMESIIWGEDKIIDDILSGDLVDTEEIMDRYKGI